MFENKKKLSKSPSIQSKLLEDPEQKKVERKEQQIWDKLKLSTKKLVADGEAKQPTFSQAVNDLLDKIIAPRPPNPNDYRFPGDKELD